MKKRKTYLIFLILLVLPYFAIAANTGNNDLNEFKFQGDIGTTIANFMKELFKLPIDGLSNSFNSSQEGDIALGIFSTLFVIQTIWLLSKTYAEAYVDPLKQVVSMLLVRVVSGSFLWWLVIDSSGLPNGSGFISEIIQFFMNVAGTISPTFNSSTFYSSGQFQAGDLIGTIWDQFGKSVNTIMGIFNGNQSGTGGFSLDVGSLVSDALLGFFMRLVMFIAMCILMYLTFMTSWMLLFKVCEFIVVAYGTVFMIGFVGSTWTKSYFDNYIKYIVNLTIEFFVIIIILNYGTKSIMTFAATNGMLNVFLSMLVLICNFYFMYELLKLAPKIAAAVSAGTPQVSIPDSTSAMTNTTMGTAAAAGGIAGGVAGAVGGAIKGATQGAAGGLAGMAAGAAKGAAQGAVKSASAGSNTGVSTAAKFAGNAGKLGDATGGNHNKKREESRRNDAVFDSALKNLSTMKGGMNDENKAGFDSLSQTKIDSLAASLGIGQSEQASKQRKYNIGKNANN